MSIWNEEEYLLKMKRNGVIDENLWRYNMNRSELLELLADEALLEVIATKVEKIEQILIPNK